MDWLRTEMDRRTCFFNAAFRRETNFQRIPPNHSRILCNVKKIPTYRRIKRNPLGARINFGKIEFLCIDTSDAMYWRKRLPEDVNARPERGGNHGRNGYSKVIDCASWRKTSRECPSCRMADKSIFTLYPSVFRPHTYIHTYISIYTYIHSNMVLFGEIMFHYEKWQWLCE